MAVNYNDLAFKGISLIKGGDAKWSSLSISYSFLSNASLPDYYSPSWLFWDINYGFSVGSEDFRNFTNAQMTAVHQILDAESNTSYRVSFSDVVKFSFSDVTDAGTGLVTFIDADVSNITAPGETLRGISEWPDFSASTPQAGDIFIDDVDFSGDYNNVSQG